jgi:hypothetical protein
VAVQVKRNRRRERGSAMLVTMIIITAMTAGAAAMASLQMASTKSTELVTNSTKALYCAEAGLAAGRAAVVANYAQWNAAFAAGTEPAWLQAISHDLDGDGRADFALSVKDNYDEGSATNNAARDNDRAAYLTSTCIEYPESPRAAIELVQYNGGGQCYESQQGGCGGNNNADR